MLVFSLLPSCTEHNSKCLGLLLNLIAGTWTTWNLFSLHKLGFCIRLNYFWNSGLCGGTSSILHRHHSKLELNFELSVVFHIYREQGRWCMMIANTPYPSGGFL